MLRFTAVQLTTKRTSSLWVDLGQTFNSYNASMKASVMRVVLPTAAGPYKQYLAGVSGGRVPVATINANKANSRTAIG
jgi:hypothetical protein